MNNKTVVTVAAKPKTVIMVPAIPKSIDVIATQGKEIVYLPIGSYTNVGVVSVLAGSGIAVDANGQLSLDLSGVPISDIAVKYEGSQNYVKQDILDGTVYLDINKTSVGLSNVENLSPADLPISNATALALNSKTNQIDFENEVTARINADIDLQNQINQKASNSALSTEINDRIEGDAELQQQVDDLNTKMDEKSHYLGAFGTTAELLAYPDPTPNDVADNYETDTRWIYDSLDGGLTYAWRDTEQPIPGLTDILSDEIPLMDGVASAGTGAKASRYDHRHASDTSRATVVSLNTEITNRTNADTLLQTNINAKADKSTTITINGEVHNLSGNQSYYIERVDKADTVLDTYGQIYYGMWVGTLSQYDAAISGGANLDQYVVYITDDFSEVESTYTKLQVDALIQASITTSVNNSTNLLNNRIKQSLSNATGTDIQLLSLQATTNKFNLIDTALAGKWDNGSAVLQIGNVAGMLHADSVGTNSLLIIGPNDASGLNKQISIRPNGNSLGYQINITSAGIFPDLNNDLSVGISSRRFNNGYFNNFNTNNLTANNSTFGNINATYIKATGNDGLGQASTISAIENIARGSGGWRGRILAGVAGNGTANSGLTFLMGEYNGLAGLGAHYWSQFPNNAAWAPFWLNPDGPETIGFGLKGAGTAGWTNMLTNSAMYVNNNTGQIVVNGTLVI